MKLSLLCCFVTFALSQGLHLAEVTAKEIAELSNAFSNQLHIAESAVRPVVKLDATVASRKKSIDLVENVAADMRTKVSRKAAENTPARSHLEPIAEVPEASVVRDIGKTHDGVTQGETASCHIFATTSIIQDATGIRLSNAKAFLDHLVNAGLNSEDALVNKNMEFVDNHRLLLDSPRSRCHFDWEAGHLIRNINRMKVVGGIVVPSQDDWKEIEAVMQKLGETRSQMIKEPYPLDPANARTRLIQGGIGDIVKMASATVDKEGYPLIFDRTYIASILSSYDVAKLPLASNVMTRETIQERITSLVNTLETRAVWVGVDADFYYQMLSRRKKAFDPATLISQGKSFPAKGNHAIALVGYDIDRNQFLVKDSNLPHVVYIDAEGFVMTVASGFVLIKRI